MTRQRILLAQTAFLGDVILTTPLVAALRRHDPAAEITMLVTPAARLYTERVPRPLALHDRDRLAGLLAPLGVAAIAPADAQPRIVVEAAAQTRADALLAPPDDRPLAAICPGSAWRTKRWPLAAF